MKTSVLTLACLAMAASAHAQGTIQFSNSGASKIKAYTPSGVFDAPIGTVVGVFWGHTPDQLTLVEQTTVISTPGLFNGGIAYAIPGTFPGEQIALKIAAWYNANGPTPTLAPRGGASPGITCYGETFAVITAPLGPTFGPGTVVWQRAAGTSPDRMKPFAMSGICVPEPSVAAIGIVALATLLRRRRQL